MLQPRGPRVLVKRLDEPAQAEGSLIIIPDTVDAKPSAYGLVLAVGTLVHGGFGPGDVVLMKDYSGFPVQVKLVDDDSPETECSLVMEDDVLAVLDGMGL